MPLVLPHPVTLGGARLGLCVPLPHPVKEARGEGLSLLLTDTLSDPDTLWVPLPEREGECVLEAHLLGE